MRARRTWYRNKGSRGISCLSKNDKLSIYHALSQNPFCSSRDIISRCKLSCSIQTVTRYLTKAGFIRRKPKTTLDLTQHHIEMRALWADNMRTFRYWENVSLSMNVQYGWMIITVLAGSAMILASLSVDKLSGKIQVFGAITVFGKLCIKTFHGNMNSAMYCDIVKEDIIPKACFHMDGCWFRIILWHIKMTHYQCVFMRFPTR